MTGSVGIIGAGVGGLAAGLALAQTGWQVQVFEQAPKLAEVGAGIQIAPNGSRVLRHLGLDLSALGQPNPAVVLHTHQGREITCLVQTSTQDAPNMHVHRADLIAALAAAFARAGGQLHLNSPATLADPASATLETKTQSVPFDLVIAADGLNSQTRHSVFAAPPPRFSGHVAWRALVAGVDHAQQTNLYMGPGRHLVSYPLRGGHLTNIVAVSERNHCTPEGWSHPDDPRNLQTAFADFGATVTNLLAKVGSCHLWGLYDHPPMARFHAGQTALLGDACHAMVPFMAQGACMALEDAAVLAQCLEKEPDTPAALAHYSTLRTQRTASVAATARGNARIYHLRPAALRLPLHLGMAIAGKIAPSLMTHRYTWITDFDATDLA